jgi:hypothetical protein
MNDPGRHIPLFGELARGNRFDPGVGSQLFFDERELVARWDKLTPDVRTKITEAARANDLLIKSRVLWLVANSLWLMARGDIPPVAAFQESQDFPYFFRIFQGFGVRLQYYVEAAYYTLMEPRSEYSTTSGE